MFCPAAVRRIVAVHGACTVVVAALLGCLDPVTIECGDLLCPPDMVCAAEAHRCVLPAQLTACEGQEPEALCSYQGVGGRCFSGACLVRGCGNGVVEDDGELAEVCDDGNLVGGDGCSRDCLSDETCGNRVIDAHLGESCDDGGTESGDGCSEICVVETCGNGVVEDDGDTPEVCDDGNIESGDGCRADCRSDETCGNEVIDAHLGETCDDGNTQSGDGCSADCHVEGCGGGGVDDGEVCDDGNTRSGDGCSADCQSLEVCGNGIVDVAIGEACDDGNTEDGDGCQSNCAYPSCGDGSVDFAYGEVCDDGNTEDGDGCSATCVSNEQCGNGTIDVNADPPESCDDGDVIPGDGCGATCRVEICGGGAVDDGEVCDDGNNLPGDGCSPDCLSDETCGNGITDVGAMPDPETCDAGAENSDDPDAACRTDCTIGRCGDGILDTGEDCDLTAMGAETCLDFGYRAGTLGCAPGCFYVFEGCTSWCGDGTIQSGPGEDEECDGNNTADETCLTQGFYGGDIGCFDNCTLDTGGCEGFCGDGIKNGTEVCDGHDFGDETCSSQQFYSGSLECAGDCTEFYTTGCSGECGDAVKNGPELCDGAEVGLATCEALGYHSGTLSCAPGVCDDYDTSGCGGYCGDGVINGGEQCDGHDQNGESCLDLGAFVGRLGCNAFCQRTYDRCRWADWEAVSSNTNARLLSIWGRNAHDVWAVGGSTVHFDGGKWTDEGDPLVGAQVLRGVSGSVETGFSAYAVGDGGNVFGWTGSAWQPISGAPVAEFRGVWVGGDTASTVELWAVAENGHVYRWRPADALPWTDLGVPPGAAELNGVWGSGVDDAGGAGSEVGDIIWIVGNNGKVYFWTGTGFAVGSIAGSSDILAVRGDRVSRDAWAVGEGGHAQLLNQSASVNVSGGPNTGDLRGVWLGRDSIPLAVGTDEIWRRTSFGWALDEETGDHNDVWGSGPEDVWAVGNGGSLFHYWGGWNPDRLGSPAALQDIWGSSITDLYAVAASGEIWYFDGWRWALDSTPDGRPLNAVFGEAGSEVWAAGKQGVLLRKSGSDWEQVVPPAVADFQALWGTDANDLWLVGSAGTILHFDGAWTVSTSGTGADLYDVFGSSETEVWVVGDAGTILRYDGAWSSVASGTTTDLRAVWANGPSDVWAVGAAGTLLHYDGTGWAPQVSGATGNLTSIWGSAADDIWIMGEGLELRHFDGTDWAPASIFGVGDLNAMWGLSDRNVWAVGSGGSIYHFGHSIPALDGGECTGFADLYCGSVVHGAVGSSSLRDDYGCMGGARQLLGGESYYRFHSPIRGDVTFTLTPRDNDVDLILGGGVASCDFGGTCLAHSAEEELAFERILWDASPGEVLWVAADGVSSGSAFTLEVTCAAP